jgi:dienelactone hydrolase
VTSYTSGIPSGQDYVTPTIYYTTDTANCPAPFPGVVVAPGFTEYQSAVNQWGTFLASHGFVVMMVDTASGGVGNTSIAPAQREMTLMEGVATLKAENTRSGSPLSGKINTALMAVMGHSMGGGGTLITANDHPELKAAIGLCPWNASINYAMDTVPSLLFTGTADGLVSVGTGGMGPNEYASIPATTHKMYSEFNGGSHLVANTPLGAAATDTAAARFGLSWLEVYEVGDTRYQQFFVKDATNSVWDMKP